MDCGGTKTVFFRPAPQKRVTGAIAKPTHLEAEKRLHKKYSEARDLSDRADQTEQQKRTAARRAIGLLQAIAQIDVRMTQKASGMTEKLRQFVR